MIHLFIDRKDAGEQLLERLTELGWDRPPLKPDLVLGLARGGTAVARPVALGLGTRWDVSVVRKIGAPGDEELGVGALCEDGVPLLSKAWLKRLGLKPEDLTETVTHKQADLQQKVALYRGHPIRLASAKNICVVDDGLATGVSAEAAAHYLRRQGVSRLTLAIPVAAPESLHKLKKPGSLYDEIIALESPSAFGSVGSWYENFGPVEDKEVLELLKTSRHAPAA